MLTFPLLTALAASVLSNPNPTPTSTTDRIATLLNEAGLQAEVQESHHSFWQVSGGLVTTASSDGPGEEIDFDEGWALSLLFGHVFHESGRGSQYSWELEGLYTDQEADDDGVLQAVRDVTAVAVLANLVGEWPLNDTFGVYAGGGVGAAWLSVGVEDDALHDFEEDDGPFLAWNLKAGVALHASEVTSWRLGYRFMNIDDVEIDDEGLDDADFDLQTEQHILELGVRFSI